MLGFLCATGTSLRPPTVLGGCLPPALLQHALATAFGRGTPASAHNKQQPCHYDDRDHDDRDDQSSGHVLPPLLFRRGFPPERRRNGGASSARDQNLAAEIRPGLLERDVGRREDHVRGVEPIVADRLPLLADEREQAIERLVEMLPIATLTRRDRVVVELIQLGGVVVPDVVLPLGGDPDDHGACPWEGPACSASAGAAAGELPAPSSPTLVGEPVPSSAFIFASSESTSLVLDSALS